MKRLSIPKKLVEKIGLKVGDIVYLLPLGNPAGVEILTYKVVKGQSSLMVNVDGGLRIGQRMLKAYGIEDDNFEVGLGETGKSIMIKKV